MARIATQDSNRSQGLVRPGWLPSLVVQARPRGCLQTCNLSASTSRQKTSPRQNPFLPKTPTSLKLSLIADVSISAVLPRLKHSRTDLK